MVNFAEAWVLPAGAGIGGRLTTAAGHSKHLAALDQVVDGSVHLWENTHVSMYTSSTPRLPRLICPEPQFLHSPIQTPNIFQAGHHKWYLVGLLQEPPGGLRGGRWLRTLELIDESSGFFARDC